MNGIHKITDAEYFALDALNNSTISKILRSPLHATVETPANTAMQKGTATHTAILEPYEFENRTMRGPDDRRGNKWKDALEEAGDKLLLVASEYDDVLRMRDAVHADPKTAQLINGNDGQVEITAVSDWDGIKCKSKNDLVRPSLSTIVDLKTTSDASKEGFAKSVANFGYHRQAVWYLKNWNRASEDTMQRFLFLAVESSPPYAHAIYELDEEAMREGERQINNAMNIYAQCLESGEWPGYPSGVQPLSLPRWAIKPVELKGVNL